MCVRLYCLGLHWLVLRLSVATVGRAGWLLGQVLLHPCHLFVGGIGDVDCDLLAEVLSNLL